MFEDLREKQKQEVVIQEELETVKDILKSEKQNLAEVVADRDKVRSLCNEKDSTLQVIFIYFFNFLLSDSYFWSHLMTLVTYRLCYLRKTMPR